MKESIYQSNHEMICLTLLLFFCSSRNWGQPRNGSSLFDDKKLGYCDGTDIIF